MSRPSPLAIGHETSRVQVAQQPGEGFHTNQPEVVMSTSNGAVAVSESRKAHVMGRPKKSDYVLQVSITRKLRNKYVKGSCRTLNLQNSPWEEDEFASMVERMAQKAAGKSIGRRPTTKTVTL